MMHIASDAQNVMFKRSKQLHHNKLSTTKPHKDYANNDYFKIDKLRRRPANRKKLNQFHHVKIMPPYCTPTQALINRCGRKI